MTAPPENPGWRAQLAIHRAVRRDISRLGAALAEGRDTPASAIRNYWKTTAELLHHHHELEDTIAYPMMLERLGPHVEPLLTRNAHEHVAMAVAMDKFDTVLFTTTDATAGRLALAQLHEAVELHLTHEEADVLPLIPEALSLEEIGFISAQAAKMDEPSVFLPWLLDEAPDVDVAFFTAPMPGPVRSDLDGKWMPAWRKTVDALRLTEPTVSAR